MWSIFDRNSYKYHINLLSKERRTDNSSVCISGNTHTDEEIYYYGVLLKKYMQLHYPRLNEKLIFLFNYDLFDLSHSISTRKHKTYMITSMKLSGKF